MRGGITDGLDKTEKQVADVENLIVQLTATFVYATPGAEGLRQAIKLLNGEKIEPVITLPTMLINKDNAPDILKANGLL